jgi:hypothetical protein
MCRVFLDSGFREDIGEPFDLAEMTPGSGLRGNLTEARIAIVLANASVA